STLSGESVLEFPMRDPASAEKYQTQRHTQRSFRMNRFPAFNLGADRVSENMFHACCTACPVSFKPGGRAPSEELQPVACAISITAMFDPATRPGREGVLLPRWQGYLRHPETTSVTRNPNLP